MTATPTTAPVAVPTGKIHVMHDFESWALKSAIPCLISLGGVKFTKDAIVDNFHVRVDPSDCQRLGLEIEAETVEWWMHKDRQQAREQLEELGKVDLYAALDGYAMWVRQTPTSALGSAWSNGSNFDNARLKQIYLLLGLDWPFSYKQEECYRTMRNRFPDVPFTRVGVHHGALDDADSQARHLQLICASNLIEL